MSYVTESDIRVKSYDHSNFRELPLFNFKRVDELCLRIGHPFEKLWPFEYLESFRCAISSVSISYVPNSNIRVKSYDHSNLSRAFVVQFRASRWVMSPNRTSVWKVMTIRICRELRCSIPCVSIYYAPESDLRVKSYDHLNFEGPIQAHDISRN